MWVKGQRASEHARTVCIACNFLIVEKIALEHNAYGHATSMQKRYDSWAKSINTLGIRPLKEPSGHRIRTKKWSNPLYAR